MRKSCLMIGIALFVGLIGGVVLVLVALPHLNMQIVRQGSRTAPPQVPPPPPDLQPPGNPPPPGPSAPGGPDWEFVSALLRPHGNFAEATVNYLGSKRPNSLATSDTRTGTAEFFWALAELPATYTQRKPTRLEAMFAVDDMAQPNSAFKFELRLNNGSPQTFDVRPNVPARVDVSIVDVYRVDVRVIGVGEGAGRPIIIEPKFFFR